MSQRIHAYNTLQAQGVVVTWRSLAKAAGMSVGRALMFLRLHRSETPKETRVMKKTAIDFLKARSSKSHAA